MFFSNRQHTSTTKKPPAAILHILIITLGLLGVWDLGFGAKHKPIGFQQLDQTGIRGVLINVPLRDVLSQLKESFGFEYIAAEEELDKPVSVELTGETLVEALPKILSSWDYALKRDRQGNVRYIYVVKKSAPDYSKKPPSYQDLEPEISPSSEKSPEELTEPVEPEPGGDSEMPGLDLPQEEGASPSQKVISAELAKMLLPPDASDSDSDAAKPVMEIQESTSPQMEIIPPSDLPEMTIIPPSAFPPMEIFPVSDEDRQAFGERAMPANPAGEKPSTP